MSSRMSSLQRLRPRTGRAAMAAATVLALLAGSVLGSGAAVAAPKHPAPGTTAATGAAGVVVTTADGTQRLAASTVAPTTAAPKGAPEVVTLDGAGGGQAVVGFGAALTHSSAALFAGMPADERRALLTELFAPAGPVRLSVLRIPIGASDFTVGPAFTLADAPVGERDWGLSRFSLAPDERHLLPVLREIRAIAPDLQVVASPWSAPAWMKESGSLYGGRLETDAPTVQAYANYLVRTVTAYRDAGVPIDVLTVQNEPQTRWPADYPRTDMPVATQVAVIGALGPALRAAGLPTTLLGFDHNWAQHPADVSALPAGADPEHDYAARVLSSTAASWVAGTAFHCYYGDASAQSALRTAFPTKSIWLTECSGSHGPGDAPAKIFSDTLGWHARHLLVASLQHWASAVLTWNLALDASGGPHAGGCETCTGVVTVDRGSVVRNAEYHVLTHAARYLPRESVRVPTTSRTADLQHVSFATPDGGRTTVAHNSGAKARSVTLHRGGRYWTVSVPARALVTVTLPAA